jgi:hypothetical protein
MGIAVMRLAALGICLTACTGSIGDLGHGSPSNPPDGPGSTTGSPTTTSGTPTSCVDTASSTSPAVVRRLTRWEYANTIADVLGMPIGPDVTALLPPDIRSNGFSNDIGGQLATAIQADAYQKTADAVGAAVAKTPGWLAPFAMCNQVAAACRDDVVRALGLRLFRRPVTTDEGATFGALFDAAIVAGLTTVRDAGVVVVRAMLQSPQFLYRLETQISMGTALRAIDPYELASRLSYLIWGSAPDDVLLGAASSGELTSPDGLKNQVARMLAGPHAREVVQRYFREWLALDDLDDATRSPAFTPQLAADMKSETLDVVGDQLWDKGQPMLSLFTTRSTIVTPALAAHYGLGVPGSNGKTSIEQASGRAGLLTHAGVLTVDGDANASIVQRGLFLLRKVLCEDVGVPPPGATAVKLAPDTASERTKSEVRIRTQPCQSCHGQFDPLAYSFEPFDSMGAAITQDANGNAVRQDGWITRSGAANVPYADVRAEMDLLVQDPRVAACVATKVAQFAWGRPMDNGDRCMLDDVRNRIDATKTKGFADILTAIVDNPDFRTTRVQ